eukprot:9284071-Alexandrium_andersonii.AAC.1
MCIRDSGLLTGGRLSATDPASKAALLHGLPAPPAGLGGDQGNRRAKAAFRGAINEARGAEGTLHMAAPSVPRRVRVGECEVLQRLRE